MRKHIIVKQERGGRVTLRDKNGSQQWEKFINDGCMMKTFKQVNVIKVDVYSFEICNTEKLYQQFIYWKG